LEYERSSDMKKNREWIIALILFVLPLAALSGLELETFFSIGNIALEDTGSPSTEYPWGITVGGTQQLSESMSIQAGYTFDPILKNVVHTNFVYKEQFFTIGVGPFFGLFNSASTLMQSGISTSVAIEWPGIFFVSFRADNTIGGRLVQTGDYLQELNKISAGFYVPNAICSVSILTKRYSEKTDTAEAVSNLTEYTFQTDLYKKNVPYSILLTFGYQQIQRILDAEAADGSTYTLGSLILGTKITLKVSPAFSIVADLSSSIYSFGLDELLGASLSESEYPYFFHLITGVQFKI